jgi:hypothetical protein
MNTRKITLLFVVLGALILMATACNQATSGNANANSSSVKSSNSPAGTSATVSKRFVGTWAEEGVKSDQGSKFTEDGRIIELSSNNQVGTYTTSGDDEATINMAEGKPTTATLESDTRMKMVVAGETVYLTKK